MFNPLAKIFVIMTAFLALSGCLVTSVMSSAAGTAVNVVDAVTPDIID